ncbi:hypothetical protein BJ878DRAFT_542836 [Calycina marina]|uniref:UspA domain-containing protein n=1 Tax=Calycina marina TaxID=1763456 RepID=A0A9P7Z1Y4_9HELO|nr:hypothetical protein BJ878DRAFT_542836 [Calycina marina]
MSNPTSMEAALDQEAKEVLALLEGNHSKMPSGSTAGGNRSSPYSPRSPVRSMLDIGPSSSSASTSAGGNSGRGRVAVRSMLDIAGSPSSVNHTRSAQSSPTATDHQAVRANTAHPRTMSDDSGRPLDPALNAPGFESPSPYQISGFATNKPAPAGMPKRNTQGASFGKKASGSMAEVIRTGDFVIASKYEKTKDRGRNLSRPETGISTTAKSRSPHNRLGLRSDSPVPGSGSDPSKFTLQDGRVLDLNNAYRRLSDGNLALAGGTLSTLSEKVQRRRQESTDPALAIVARLEKDYVPLEGEDAVLDSSEEDLSSDEGSRGRKKGRNNSADKGFEPQTISIGRASGPRTPRSLMAAAEEERTTIAAQEQQKQARRSLLDIEPTTAGAVGTKAKSSRSGVHPHTSYDDMAFGTPYTSENEKDTKDVKEAQKLSIQMTVITSTPATKRCVRSIYRGDFNQMLKEADENSRRVRKYIVATDLSAEAQHALEWTIGTVLRDGDALLAIYCVDEEIGIMTPEVNGDARHEAQAVAVAASAVASISSPRLQPVPDSDILSSGFQIDSGTNTPSSMGRTRGKEEQTRMRAVQAITNTVTKLLRKTKLQVKIVVEVLHCKSPKHLITDVIDYLSPTLVILGSRGQSALKGVILGSFSNYLVTKSSVPVMVARKKLSKKTSRIQSQPVRQPNNLGAPSATRKLEDAVIEKPIRKRIDGKK